VIHRQIRAVICLRGIQFHSGSVDLWQQHALGPILVVILGLGLVSELAAIVLEFPGLHRTPERIEALLVGRAAHLDDNGCPHVFEFKMASVLLLDFLQLPIGPDVRSGGDAVALRNAEGDLGIAGASEEPR
jgi:hypothetical protein